MGCDNGTIRVHDIRTGDLNGTLGPHPGSVSSLHFSSNGYHLAETSSADTTIRIWDLRKATDVAFELEASSTGAKVRWDQSGAFLACGGDKGVEVWAYAKKSKTFEKVTGEPLEAGGVKCLEWGVDGRWIACGGLEDGTICLLGVKEE
jgi:pre-mRNA-processing factor 19